MKPNEISLWELARRKARPIVIEYDEMSVAVLANSPTAETPTPDPMSLKRIARIASNEALLVCADKSVIITSEIPSPLKSVRLFIVGNDFPIQKHAAKVRECLADNAVIMGLDGVPVQLIVPEVRPLVPPDSEDDIPEGRPLE